MRPLRGWILRLVSPFTRGRAERELDAELASIFDMHVDANLRAGMTAAEARRHAHIALGSIDSTKDAYRDQQGFPMMDALVRDCRHGIRLLLRSPGFTLTAVLILGLGIGANAAMFSVVDAVLLRPLPFPESNRVMRIWHTPPPELFPGTSTFSVSPANFYDWRAQSTAFDAMALYGYRSASVTGTSSPEALEGAIVSGDFFRVLRASPIVGRTLSPADDVPGRAKVVVVSEHVWDTRFARDPHVVGRTLNLDGEPYTIVGVLPDAMRFPDWASMWLPMALTPAQRAVRGNHNRLAIARLRDGADVDRAQAELTTISERLAQEYPGDNKGWGAVVLPLQQDLVGDVRQPLLLLLGAVACVLLIACANLANLLLARGLARSKEIAIRTAIGASRGRMVQQMLVESTLLALAGAAVGLGLAGPAVRGIVAFFGRELPGAAGIGIGGQVLAFTCALAVLTGIVAGIAPAWRLAHADPSHALKQGQGRGGSHAGERRLHNLLVAVEVALALVLLVGAGLLIRTLSHLRAVDPGVDPRNVLTMAVALPDSKYPHAADQTRFFAETLRRIRAIPGVESASAIDTLPLQEGGSTQPVAVEGRPAPPLSQQPEVAVRSVTPGYLHTVRMRVDEGRDFTDQDGPDAARTVLVSASMARRFWPNERALGKRLTLGLMSPEPRQVVGIVSDVKLLRLDTSEPVPTVYVPLPQMPQGGVELVVRTLVPPSSIVPSAVRAIRATDPDQPVLEVKLLDEVIGQSIVHRRFAMRLLTAFAALALLLAAVGIYAVLAYSVRRRAQEIGIRMALGANRARVMRMLVLEGLKPTLGGLAAGIAGAAALGRLIATMVYGVSAHDTATFAAVSLLLVAVAALASVLPAIRATRIDPLLVLRTD